jgi:predicted ester cyclase
MSVGDNKQVVARFVEVCQNHSFPGGRPLPATTRPTEAFQRYYGMFLAAFPDATMQIEEQIAEGDLVVTRKTFLGKHLGEQWGLPPTGNRVQVEFIDIFRIQDGQLAEHWHHFDFEELYSQMRPAQTGPATQQPGGTCLSACLGPPLTLLGYRARGSPRRAPEGLVDGQVTEATG